MFLNGLVRRFAFVCFLCCSCCLQYRWHRGHSFNCSLYALYAARLYQSPRSHTHIHTFWLHVNNLKLSQIFLICVQRHIQSTPDHHLLEFCFVFAESSSRSSFEFAAFFLGTALHSSACPTSIMHHSQARIFKMSYIAVSSVTTHVHAGLKGHYTLKHP